MIGPMSMYDEVMYQTVDRSAILQLQAGEVIYAEASKQEEEPQVTLLEKIVETRLLYLAQNKGISEGATKSLVSRYVNRYLMYALKFGLTVIRTVSTAAMQIVRWIFFNLGRVLIRFIITPLITMLAGFLATPAGWAVAAVAGVVGGGYLLYKYLVGGEAKDEEHKLSPNVEISEDGKIRINSFVQNLANFEFAENYEAAEYDEEGVEVKAARTSYEYEDDTVYDYTGAEDTSTAPVSPGVMQAGAREATKGAKPGKLSEAALYHAMDSTGMTHPVERAMFMAQMSHESGGFRYNEEVWGPTAIQLRYQNHRYLGNKEPGDGYKFRGRGYIQLTGRSNYEQAGKYLGIDLINNPDLAADPDVAALVALWYWRVARKSIPRHAREGNIRAVTKLINGGEIGLPDRTQRFKQYLAKEQRAAQLGTTTSPPKSEVMEQPSTSLPSEQQTNNNQAPKPLQSKPKEYASYNGVVIEAEQ